MDSDTKQALESMEARIMARFEKSDESIRARFEQTDESVRARFEQIDERIHGRRTQIAARFPWMGQGDGCETAKPASVRRAPLGF
jgi:hypothetical protein